MLIVKRLVLLLMFSCIVLQAETWKENPWMWGRIKHSYYTPLNKEKTTKKMIENKGFNYFFFSCYQQEIKEQQPGTKAYNSLGKPKSYITIGYTNWLFTGIGIYALYKLYKI